MLKIDTGGKKREASGTTPQRFKQSIQWAGRTALRLLHFGAGNAKDKWPEGHPFRDGNPALAEGGGIVVLDVNFNGEDYDVIDAMILPNNSKVETEQKLIAAFRKIGADNAATAAAGG